MENCNTLHKIDVPKEWEIESDWSSHRPLLYLALKNTIGNVVELGSGFGSTPLLREYCLNSNRQFLSFETNKEWAAKTGSKYIPDYFKQKYRFVDLMFIDCAPGEIRKELLNEFKSIATVIVIHDSEISANYVYGLKDILSDFSYRLDFQPENLPHTTAVSNFINLSQWESHHESTLSLTKEE